MNTTKNNKKQARRNKTRRVVSFKGKRGNQVGAPPKSIHFPNGAFTMASAFKVNRNQCNLSVRKKVNQQLESGDLIQLVPRKQAKHGVGRPMAVFVKKDKFNAEKMTALHPETLTARTIINIAIPTDAPVAAPVVVAEVPAAPVAEVQPEVQAPVGPEQPVIGETTLDVATPFNVETAREYVAGLDITPAVTEAPATV